MLEIERKFLIDGFLEDICSKDEYSKWGIDLLDEIELEQGYVSIQPEIRIHSAKNIHTGEMDFRLTLKGDGKLTRTEIKTDVDENFFKETVSFLGVPMIQKEYKSYRFGQWILEVCRVDANTENDFFYAEIEFETEEEANAFEVPKFFGTEVTEDDDYKMKNYWKRTRECGMME